MNKEVNKHMISKESVRFNQFDPQVQFWLLAYFSALIHIQLL